MEDFDKYMSRQQSSWRKKHLDNQDWGKQNRWKRSWILPKNLWEQSLWSGMRGGSSCSLPKYLAKNDVQKHSGVHNLKSSWILCANLYFPFRQDKGLLAGFLNSHVSSLIEDVIGVELEYAEKRPLDPTTLLGEPKGQRGRNQTSPDVAFTVFLKSGRRGLILTENKFVEHSFYGCSGRVKKHGNPDRKRCMNFRNVYNDLQRQCYILNWARGRRTNRKYWDYLKFTDRAHKVLRRCPAATAGWQLFRQQALAEGIARSNRYELMVSCVAYDGRNETLMKCLRGSGIKDFTQDWAPLFEGKAKFATFTHQQWINWVSKHDKRDRWRDWLTYVRERYEFS